LTSTVRKIQERRFNLMFLARGEHLPVVCRYHRQDYRRYSSPVLSSAE
jgi:hypothetical protein